MNPTDQPTNGQEKTDRGATWFLGISLAALVLTCGMLAGRPDFLLTYTMGGHAMAWMILLLYGVAMPGIFGAVYWALPWMYRVPLYSGAFVWLHFAFHLAGTGFSMAALFWPELPQAAMGQTFLACGAIVFAVNVGCTLRQIARPDAASAFFTGAMVWLLVAMFMGAPFAGKAPLPVFEGTQWSAGWLVLIIAGVFLNAMMGMAMRLSPESLGVPTEMTNRGWYALSFTNISLGWIFAAITLGPLPFLIIAACVFLTGVVLFWMEFFSVLQRRNSPGLDWDARILLSAFSMAPLAAAFLWLAAWDRMGRAPVEAGGGGEFVLDGELAETSGAMPLEYLPVDGAIFLTAMLAVIIPGVVAILFQLLKIQREPAFAARFRIADQILLASFFNYATGVMMVVPGAWAGIGQILSLGTLFMVIGALGFLGNFLYALAPADWLDREHPAAVPSA